MSALERQVPAQAGAAVAASSTSSAEAPLAMLSLLASGLVWGLAWWPLRYFAGAGLSGHMIGLTAYTFVALAALPLIWRERAQWKSEQRLLLLIGLFFGCANMAFTAALAMGPVVRAMLLFYLLPAWGALGGALFLRERIGPRRMVAVALSLGGVFVIVGGTEVFRQPLSAADALALAAGFCYTAAGIANRKAKAIPIASRTLISFLGCTVVALLAMLVTVPALPDLSLLDWSLVLLFAFVWLLGGTLLTTYGVTHVQASRAAVLQVSELLVAIASAIWLGGESMAEKEYIGGAMIVAAALLEASGQSD